MKGYLVTMTENYNIDSANATFWNELCGTWLAENLGIKDSSPESLIKFDTWYLKYYSYLLKRVPLNTINNRKVLEVGLGYGTLGQKLAEVSSEYVGLDIADGPVGMMNHRLNINELQGKAIKGNILKAPFDEETFDAVVSIGCLHHTGNLSQAIKEVYRVLKPEGVAYIMVYNQFSYRQWLIWPKYTLRAFCKEVGIFDSKFRVTIEQKEAYDANVAGVSAPETVFSSIDELKKIFSKFTKLDFEKENCDSILGIPRQRLLPILGRRLGLDIYVSAIK